MATQITCPNCRRPFSAILEQVIDAGRDPQAKARLLSGRTNLVTCPNCSYQSMVSTPMVYHDAVKSLLLVYIPMELSLPKTEQERLVGSMTNAIINSLPQDQRRGYLFTPKMALTMQGLIEMVLEGDGVTKEMIEAQRAKMRLVETFLQVDPEQIPTLVKEHDDKLDNEFFSMMTAVAENAVVSGRRDVAEQILALREALLEQSTAGQKMLKQAETQEATMQEIAEQLNELGENATQEDVVDLVLKIVGNADEDADERLQVLVGLARPVMDYQFFEVFTKRIDEADESDKEAMSAIRDRLLELTSMVDQQNEAVIRHAADNLKAIINSPDLDEAIMSRVELLDDTFLAVLSANIRNAEQNQDIATAARLKTVFDKVVAVLQQSAPPAIQFINELMQQENFNIVRQMLMQRGHEFGPELLEWIDMLSQDIASRGNQMALNRLMQIRQEAEKVLAAPAPAPVQSTNQINFSAAASPSASEQRDTAEQPNQSSIILPFSSRKRSRKE